MNEQQLGISYWPGSGYQARFFSEVYIQFLYFQEILSTWKASQLRAVWKKVSEPKRKRARHFCHKMLRVRIGWGEGGWGSQKHERKEEKRTWKTHQRLITKEWCSWAQIQTMRLSKRKKKTKKGHSGAVLRLYHRKSGSHLALVLHLHALRWWWVSVNHRRQEAITHH